MFQSSLLVTCTFTFAVPNVERLTIYVVARQGINIDLMPSTQEGAQLFRFLHDLTYSQHQET